MLRNGKLVQVGTPGELYHKPVDSFVADFIGHTNLLRCRRTPPTTSQTYTYQTAAGDAVSVARNGEPLPDRRGHHQHPPRTDAHCARPQRRRRDPRGEPRRTANRFLGRVVETTFLGEASEHVLQVGPQRLKVVSAPPMFDVHGEMAVEFDPEDVVVLQPVSR